MSGNDTSPAEAMLAPSLGIILHAEQAATHALEALARARDGLHGEAHADVSEARGYLDTVLADLRRVMKDELDLDQRAKAGTDDGR